MKKISLHIFIASILVLSIFAIPPHAEAHFLAIDNSVGATLHIDPNDDPGAGALSTISIKFKDSRPCNCTAMIQENGQTIFTTKVPETLSFTYTFPKIDTYTLIIKGDTFTLSYNIDIDSNASRTPEHAKTFFKFLGGHSVHIIFFGAAIFISLYVIYTDKGDH